MECSVFNCLRCSNCCFFNDERDMPILLPHEVYYLKILGRNLGLKLEFKRLDNGLYKWIIHGYCPFYDERAKSCRIHLEKPFACRMFPLLMDIASGRVVASQQCTWIKKCESSISNIANNPEKLVEVFPEETIALAELIEIFYNTDSVIAIAATTKTIDNVLVKLSEKCSILKHIESKTIENLHLILLSKCSEKYIEELIGEDNIQFIIIEKPKF